jgi:putative phosphonate metabolism protein
MRVALYYAPCPNDPLWAVGAEWLGRDPRTEVASPQPAEMAAITAEPRLYGFHATLKPPMTLRDDVGWDELVRTTRAIAATIPAFDLPTLAVAELHGFLALRETAPSPELQALADACTAGADPLRAPPEAGELARRRHGGLSAAQEANLVRWGYPYVFATWKFHMTLTRRLDPAEHAAIRPQAEAWFAPALALPRRVADLCLFTQRAPGAPFVLAERAGLCPEPRQGFALDPPRA